MCACAWGWGCVCVECGKYRQRTVVPPRPHQTIPAKKLSLERTMEFTALGGVGECGCRCVEEVSVCVVWVCVCTYISDRRSMLRFTEYFLNAGEVECF